jgi:hypothetical protein
MTRWVMVLMTVMNMILVVSRICTHWEYEQQCMPAYVLSAPLYNVECQPLSASKY